MRSGERPITLGQNKSELPNTVYGRDFQEYIKNANGSTIKNVSIDMLRNYQFNIHNLDEQNKIASILNSIDYKIQINQLINRNLEEICQSNYLHMMEGSDDWKEGELSQLGTIVGGSTPSKDVSEYYTDSGIAWLTPKDLSNNKSKFISRGSIDITESGLKNSSAKVMPRGSILYTSRAPIGYIAISKNEITTNQGFKSIIPSKDCFRSYIYYYLKNNFDLVNGLASGSTFMEISGSAMKSVPIPIPDEDAATKFEKNCMCIFKQQELLESENTMLTSIRDYLLPKLMSGEIDVSKLEITN